MASKKPTVQTYTGLPPYDERLIRKKYGCAWHNDWDRQKKSNFKEDWYIELECCRYARDAPGPRPENSKPQPGNKGFKFHFMKLVDIIFGDKDSFWYYEWNPNSERMLDAFLKHRKLGVLGHASSGKSFFLAVLSVTLFFIYSQEVKIIITSTTQKASEGKIWGEVSKAWQQIEKFMSPSAAPGRNIKSENLIRFEYNGMFDTTAGIQLIASEAGADADSAVKVQGYKIKGGFLVVLADELDTLNDSLMNTFQSNLSANKRARFIGPFNPTSRSTVAGRFVEPEDGWHTLNEENAYEWKTKVGGFAIRFDGLLCPNVVEGKELYGGLLTVEAIEEMEKQDGGRDSAGFWRNVRAWFSPIGLPDCVYDETEIIQYKATAHETQWDGRPTLIGGFDTGYTHGGDKCILTIAKVGQAQRQGRDGPILIKVVDIIHQIAIDQNMKVAQSKEEQVTRKLLEILKKPEFAEPKDSYPLTIGNIALDVTGGGNISPLIRRDIGEPFPVNFKSKPSDKVVSLTDKRKGTDRFITLRDQMWIVPRGLIRSEQLKGFTSEMIRQACACRFDLSDRASGKQSVEPKKELAKRLKHSPDEMDSAILCIHTAVEKFGLFGIEKTKKMARAGYKIVTRKNILGQTVEEEVKLPTSELARFRENYKRPQEGAEVALTMTFEAGTYEA
jgi:hypothetical protein